MIDFRPFPGSTWSLPRHSSQTYAWGGAVPSDGSVEHNVADDAKNVMIAIPWQNVGEAHTMGNRIVSFHNDDPRDRAGWWIGMAQYPERTPKPEAKDTGRPSADGAVTVRDGGSGARAFVSACDMDSNERGQDKIRNIVRGDLERKWWFSKGLVPRIPPRGETGELGGRRWELSR
jgi:hypothetical protein